MNNKYYGLDYYNVTYNPLPLKHTLNIIFLEVFVKMQKEFGIYISDLFVVVERGEK